VQSITMLARAHQDASWRRTRAGNEPRSLLREYDPGLLRTFADRSGGITAPEARALLAIVPTPAKAARLSQPQIVAALRRAGRQHGLTTRAATIQQLRLPQLRHPALVEDAFGIPALAVLATVDAECASVDRLAEATAAAFTQHPDHRIISFVGHVVADLTGARLLAEIGDDRTQSADARALKAFAGRRQSPKPAGAASASPTARAD
jgi:hypothetical protein